MQPQNLRCQNSISTAHNEALEVMTNFGEELRPKSQWIWRNQRSCEVFGRKRREKGEEMFLESERDIPKSDIQSAQREKKRKNSGST